MDFQAWQNLNPADAARKICQGLAGLAPAARRASVAWSVEEAGLAESFASSAAASSSPLRGIPYFLKDLFDVPGIPTCAGSTFLPEVRRSSAQPSALVRDLGAAGAVLAGKTHLHEFAYGITGENPHYGDCEHPRFPGRTTGGSSSGSAVLVASGVVPFAIGTDTGGSVRLPAAFCGLYGFRTSPCDRWISDAFPLAPTFDTAGWFTAHAHDMATTLGALLPSAAATTALRGCYLSMPGLDPEVAQACERAALSFCTAADQSTRETLQRAFAHSPGTYNAIVAIEAWQVHQSWAQRFQDRYDPVVWTRLNRVRDLTSQQMDQARADLITCRKTWSDYFAQNDFLIMPASPTPALSKADCTLANRNRIFALTTPASLGGLPVLTLPVALPSGMTGGLQVIAAQPQSPVFAAVLSGQ